MKINQVAAQLFTVRDHLKTPDDIAKSLKKIRAIGYQSVQVSGMGPIEDSELVKMLNGEGLVLCATHETCAKIVNETEWVIEHLQKLNCRQVACPSPGAYDLNDPAQVDEFIKKLNIAGEALHKANQVLSYHNHGWEFRHLEGKTILDHIYDRTDARFLQGEPDTYWIQYGGGDPVEWCKKLKGRLPLLHLKDYAFGKDAPRFAEIGYGNLNWKSIIAEADKSGCEWFIVEQDTCPGDPFDSLKMSFDFIKNNLCT
jgi:sugar phosphate isomerase/epimerase